MSDLLTVLTAYEGALQEANDSPDDEAVVTRLNEARSSLMSVLQGVKDNLSQFETLQQQVEKLTGQLDIIIRELEDEPEDFLAIDYGGLGWEKEEIVVRARKAHMHLKQQARDFFGHLIAHPYRPKECVMCKAIAEWHWALVGEK